MNDDEQKKKIEELKEEMLSKCSTQEERDAVMEMYRITASNMTTQEKIDKITAVFVNGILNDIGKIKDPTRENIGGVFDDKILDLDKIGTLIRKAGQGKKAHTKLNKIYDKSSK